MSVRVQHRRDSNANVEANTPAAGELWFDTSKAEATIGDGTTAAGVRLAKKNIAEILIPAQITADTNDYNPANMKHARALVVSTDAFRDLTGLVPTTVTDAVDGREITIYNGGLQNFRLVDQSAASSANNRFDLGGASLTLSPKTSATLRYRTSGALNRWELVAQTVGSSVGAGSVIAMTLAASSQGFALINGMIATSVAGGAMTIAIKTLAGNNPSALDPVHVLVRGGTLAVGDFTMLTLTSATSLVISAGSSLGATNAAAFRVWLVGFADGGTFRLGAVNCLLGDASLELLKADTLASSTAEGGAGAADSAGVFYTGAAVASKPFAVIGYLDFPSGLAAAGTWNIAPTTTQLYHAGIRLPSPDVFDGTGRVPINRLASGAPNGWKFVRDDRTLANPHATALASALSLTDWNNAIEPGAYNGNSMANAPLGSSAWFYVEVLLYTGGLPFYTQVATGLETVMGKWTRACINGVWGAWRRLDNRVLLNTLTASGSASLDDTTSLTSEFRNYEIQLEALIPANSNVTAFLRVFVSGSWQTANYRSSVFSHGNGGFGAGGNTSGIMVINNGEAGNTGDGLFGTYRLADPTVTSRPKYIIGQGRFNNQANTESLGVISNGAYIGGNAAATGVRFVYSAGNITSGTMRIYGIGD